MRKIYHILSVALMMFITVFVLTNNAPVTVRFFGFAEFESNITIVMLVCLAGGIILRPLVIPGKQYNDIDHL